MAIIRETPKCLLCGKDTHKAIYQDQSNLPPRMVVYGDTFIKWEPIEHKCDGNLKTSDNSVVCPLCKINPPIEGFTVCLSCMCDSVK
jgi:hypothetical protein